MIRLRSFIAKRSIRGLTLLFMGAVLIPSLLPVCFLGRLLLDEKQGEAARLGHDLAHVAAMRLEEDLVQARALLEAVAAAPGLAGMDPARQRAFLRRVVEGRPRYAYLTLAGTDGGLRASTSSTDTSINFRDREQFQEALASRAFAVGQAVVSRTTGLPVLPFAAPLPGSEGEVAGVLLLGQNLEHSERFLASLNAPDGTRFLFVDSEGVRLFRFPRREKYPAGGKITLALQERVKAMPDRRGDFQLLDPEGRLTSYSLARIGGEGQERSRIMVLAGVPLPRFAERVLPVLVRLLLILGVVAAGALSLGLFLSRRIFTNGLVALERGTSGIAQGRAPVEVDVAWGCREVASLGLTFNSMVRELRRDRQARALAEEALEQVHRRFLDLVQRIPAGVFQFHALSPSEYGFEYVSERFCAILGLSGEELRRNADRFGAVVHPEDRPGLAGAFRAADEAGIRFQWEGRVLPDAQTRWVRVQADPSPQSLGDCLWNGIMSDITEQVQAQEALRESERLQALLMESIDAGIVVIDPERHVIEQVNIRAAEMFGAPIQDMLNRVCHLFLCPAHPHHCPVTDLGETVERSESVLLQAGGGSLPVLRSVRRIHVAGRDKLLETFVDISDRKQAEEALRESEGRYRAFFEGLEAVKLIVDPGPGAIVDANRAAVEFYGYSLEQLRAMTVFDLNDSPRDQVREELEQAATQAKGRFEFRHRLSNGDLREVEVHTSPVSHGGRSFLLSSIQDVTEYKQLQQMREDVEHIIRHDLKSPLTGLINIPFLLLAEGNLNAGQRELLDMVAVAGRKMLVQINSSLEMHKIEAGTYRFEPRDCDPVQLARENARMLCLGMNRPGAVEVRSALPGGDFRFPTDPLLLDIVFMNLLRNAMEASSRGQTVTVELSLAGEGRELAVAIENPRNVPEAVRERFFEKYATAGKVGGTGLGTYSAAIMVRAMGGRVELATGGGSTRVTVRLPLTCPLPAGAS